MPELCLAMNYARSIPEPHHKQDLLSLEREVKHVVVRHTGTQNANEGPNCYRQVFVKSLMVELRLYMVLPPCTQNKSKPTNHPTTNPPLLNLQIELCLHCRVWPSIHNGPIPQSYRVRQGPVFGQAEEIGEVNRHVVPRQ